MALIRGDIAIGISPGDYGKPRPVLILQSNAFQQTDSVIVALLTSDLRPDAVLFRKPIETTDGNGLRQASEIMLDKLVTLPRAKLGRIIGHLPSTEMAEITASLALLLGM